MSKHECPFKSAKSSEFGFWYEFFIADIHTIPGKNTQLRTNRVFFEINLSLAGLANLPNLTDKPYLYIKVYPNNIKDRCQS